MGDLDFILRLDHFRAKKKKEKEKRKRQRNCIFKENADNQ